MVCLINYTTFLNQPGLRFGIPSYGLYDSARKWYLNVIEELEKNEMRPVTGDEAVFYYRANNKTEGIVALHVDDFLAVGSPIFFENVMKNIKTAFKFSKIEQDEFRFCGIDIKVSENGIMMGQNEYVKNIDEIYIEKGAEDGKPLNLPEFKDFRKATGQIIWAASQTRPDLGYDSLEMSYRNKDAKIKDMKNANKIIKKAKSKESFLTFNKIGKFEDLKLVVYTDASHLKIEEKTKGVAGRIIFLSNKEENRMSPLEWKAKTIVQVCKSAKAAETRAADLATDEGLFLARAIAEIYTGKKGRQQIPMVVKSDSKSLKDSLNSTKQVEERTMRPVIEHLKQMIARKEITEFNWVDTKSCHADILTKKGVAAEKILDIFQSGKTM